MPSRLPRALQDYLPQLASSLQRGYGARDLRADLVAGLTVAIVALPLAMALAIASGTTPERGLHTAIVAGFLISALGGSRVQIGGPTAAFIPVVFNVIERFGYEGLILCTLLAGLILIAAGLLRVGALLRYMPQPVITGFTAGIAVSIFASQVKDALGLRMDQVPGEFVARWLAYWEHLPSWQPAAAGLCAAGLLALAMLKRHRPRWPAFLIVVIGGSLAALLLPVPTIGSSFGALPSALPELSMPNIPFERTLELLPAALTIAFLAGVESLLSAVVADGMTGGRHRPNAELVAQGVANAASALIGGLPATGALARTATNVRAGARSPIAGIAHSGFLLMFMLLLSPLMAYVPLPVLAALLLVVAWNMAEVHRFRQLLRAPAGDRVVLLVTFALTVAVDLTIAIEVGVVLAAFVFMHRMGESVRVQAPADEDEEDSDELHIRERLPEGVEMCRFRGPLFFAVADRLDRILDPIREPPRVFILRMRQVPLVDASGVTALEAFLDRCQKMGTAVILSGLEGQPREILRQMDFGRHPNLLGMASSFDEALAMAAAALRADPASGGMQAPQAQ
ncbi:MAG: SulP family inorganic anion transporter [Aquimonas sp.]|nr:SulP family inorganic anion transporter [Aquimonas sp.]